MAGCVNFVVYGPPATAGSKRGIPYQKSKDNGGGLGVRMIHDSKRFGSWSAEVKAAAMESSDGGVVRDLWDQPIVLTMEVFRARPKSHFGSGKNSGVLKPTAPKVPTTKPDLTKVLRALEDSLTGVLFKDDSQIVAHYTRKAYCLFGTPERVVVTLSPWSEG